MSPEQIRMRRKELKLTQIEVAIACSVSVPTYRLWEMGGTKPNTDNLIKLKDVLGGEGVGKPQTTTDNE